MTAGNIALMLGLLLLTTAAMRMPGIYDRMMRGSIDLAEVLRFRFDALSGAMLMLLSTALPK